MSIVNVPGPYDVTIAGRSYLIDWAGDVPPLTHKTIPLLRRQFDVSAEAGEASLNPEGAWRRTSTSWFRGAGQEQQDDPDSEPARFYDSREVDVWTKGELRPLPDVESAATIRVDKMVTTSNGWYGIDLVNGFVYRYDTAQAQTLYNTTWTNYSANGLLTGVASDGISVWISVKGLGAMRGVHRFTSNVTNPPTQIIQESMSGVFWANGRLIAVNETGTSAYDLSTVSYAGSIQATPSAFATLGGTGDLFSDVTDGQGHIYLAAQNSGQVYRTAVKQDGTALDTPQVAAQVPAGEAVYAVYGYLGFVIIGTDKGYRMAIQNSAGDLVLGAQIDMLGSVNNPAMVGRGRFVYVTSTGGNSSGMGVRRIDLSTLNDTTPAHATDLWIQGQDQNVYAIGFAGDRLYFSNLIDVYRAHASTLSGDGYVETGEIDFGLPEDKIVRGVTVLLEAGTATVDIITPAGTTALGTATVAAPTLSANITTTTFRVKVSLSADAVIKSFTTFAHPVGSYSDQIQVPVLLVRNQHLDYGDMAGELIDDPADDLSYLTGLRDTGSFVTYVEGGTSYTVQVTGVDWVAHKHSDDRDSFEGTAVVTMKTSGV